ncbi:unnamed protein product [Caenorhabditis auriculariae]|uniref:RUN domain-containing protein n=1 Tax=Caenorhabditis auriculariae TaxID=2777116 RepID=A0A8S1H914_9PELO|nr:unnamed protein product [Caenorhabditis auriculariae]
MKKSIKKIAMMENTALTAARHEKLRAELIKELEAVVKAAIASPHSSIENIPSEITLNVCNTIEAIFIHGLKDPFFLKGTRYAKYPEPNFWPFVSKFSHRSVTGKISTYKQIKTEIGKSRAWIRILLNENTLEHYLQLLAAEKASITQFYGEHAFLYRLRESDHYELVRGLFKPLTKLPFEAATNSSFLNSWTPSPLILAGLMTGEPLRIGALAPRRNPRAGSESEEIAVSALDMLVPEEEHNIGSPNQRVSSGSRKILRRGAERTNNSAEEIDEDDRSSVYSHPSLLDRGEVSHYHALSGAVGSRSPEFGSQTRRVSQPIRAGRSSSSSHLPFSQSPLLTSTPVERVILEAATRARQRELGQGPSSSAISMPIVANAGEAPSHSFSPLIVSRRTKRPRKTSSHSSSGTQSLSSDKSRPSQSPRQIRADSDLPSTIMGTVPDLAGLLDHGYPIGVADHDSGIEAEKGRLHPPEMSLTEAMNRLASNSTTPASDLFRVPETLTFDAFGNEAEQVLRRDIAEIGDEEVFEAATDFHGKPASRRKSGAFGAENRTEGYEKSAPDDSARQQMSVAHNDMSDSLLGTSLRDELAGVLPSTTNDVFELETPLYVMPPMIMGNSLAAIGARNQIAWESLSERSRLSSSSDSGGPVVSFGQALRSAMEGGTQSFMSDEQEANESNAGDLSESSASSRKGSKSSAAIAEATAKLCKIPREKGLDAQDFRCSMCRKSIGGPTYAKFETCGIDGKCYCVECMKPGGSSVIPSRVVGGWDWRERCISDRGRAWFESHQEKPFINIEQCNPHLYSHVPALEQVHVLREKLQSVSMYLFTCRESVADDFRRRVWPKDYLHTDIHKYSFADLMEVRNGNLCKRLTALLKHSINHVMSCTLCRQKGFVCELCSLNDVIYPFDTEQTQRCSACYSVFHKKCWQASEECPKCVRKAQFDARKSLADESIALLLQH